ncbi:MAG: Gfo/Idh/MocA family protein [Phycisphaeraceae bacterium]
MSEHANPVDVAVVGVGRMGRHHARIYHQLPQTRLAAVVDTDLERAREIADQYGCDACDSVDALRAKHPSVTAVSIAVPTRHHLAAARALLPHRIACLIEKPLAATTDECHQLVALAREHNATLQVGHTERFNPAVRAVAAMNITPRFLEVNRISPMTFRSLDVGVVMDMMIHDLDIVLTLADAPIARIDAAGVAVFGEKEDVANARLVFETGCVANLTASRLALKTERKLRCFSESAYVSLDYQKRDGLVIRSSDNAAALQQVRQQLAEGKDLSELDYSSLVQVSELSMDLPDGEDDPLTAELKSFVNAAQTGSVPVVGAEAGLAAVDAAERVVAAIAAHQWEGLEASGLKLDGEK